MPEVTSLDWTNAYATLRESDLNPEHDHHYHDPSYSLESPVHASHGVSLHPSSHLQSEAYSSETDESSDDDVAMDGGVPIPMTHAQALNLEMDALDAEIMGEQPHDFDPPEFEGDYVYINHVVAQQAQQHLYAEEAVDLWSIDEGSVDGHTVQVGGGHGAAINDNSNPTNLLIPVEIPFILLLWSIEYLDTLIGTSDASTNMEDLDSVVSQTYQNSTLTLAQWKTNII